LRWEKELSFLFKIIQTYHHTNLFPKDFWLHWALWDYSVDFPHNIFHTSYHFILSSIHWFQHFNHYCWESYFIPYIIPFPHIIIAINLYIALRFLPSIYKYWGKSFFPFSPNHYIHWRTHIIQSLCIIHLFPLLRIFLSILLRKAFEELHYLANLICPFINIISDYCTIANWHHIIYFWHHWDYSIEEERNNIYIDIIQLFHWVWGEKFGPYIHSSPNFEGEKNHRRKGLARDCRGDSGPISSCPIIWELFIFMMG